jgi:hypothetical protein
VRNAEFNDPRLVVVYDAECSWSGDDELHHNVGDGLNKALEWHPLNRQASPHEKRPRNGRIGACRVNRPGKRPAKRCLCCWSSNETRLMQHATLAHAGTVTAMSLLGPPDPPFRHYAHRSRTWPQRHYFRTSWRTMQMADSDAWRVIGQNPPFRFVRWCVVLGLVIWRWTSGSPPTAAGWWPVLFLSVVLLLPDTSGILVAGSGIQFRDAVKEVKDTAEKIRAGEGQGQAAADVARAETAGSPPTSAADLEKEILDS